jgi:hypothetical protein
LIVYRSLSSQEPKALGVVRHYNATESTCPAHVMAFALAAVSQTFKSLCFDSLSTHEWKATFTLRSAGSVGWFGSAQLGCTEVQLLLVHRAAGAFLLMLHQRNS